MERQIAASGLMSAKFSVNCGFVHAYDMGNLALPITCLVLRRNLISLLIGELVIGFHPVSFDLAVEVSGCYTGSSIAPNQSCTWELNLARSLTTGMKDLSQQGKIRC